MACQQLVSSNWNSTMVTQSTISMNCQKCGGTTDAVAGQKYYNCRYCASLLQVADVSVDRITPAGTTIDDGCPVCSHAMQTAKIENQRAMYCVNCYGVLMRHGDFGAVVSERRARRAGLEPAEPRAIDPAVYSRKIQCPVCSKGMETHPYYGPGNVVVDTCGQCGYVWLDHGELKRIEEASWMRTVDGGSWNTTPLPDEVRLAEAKSPATEETQERRNWLLDFVSQMLT
jgi:Zn-finger nucleic acid-binding protein